MSAAYWAARAEAPSSVGASAQTWVTGSSGSGRTRAQPPGSRTFTPSTNTVSRSASCSIRTRITRPLLSHGVGTLTWATCTLGNERTSLDSGSPVAPNISTNMTSVAAAS